MAIPPSFEVRGPRVITLGSCVGCVYTISGLCNAIISRAVGAVAVPGVAESSEFTEEIELDDEVRLCPRRVKYFCSVFNECTAGTTAG